MKRMPAMLAALAPLAATPARAEAKFSAARIYGRDDCRRVTLASHRSRERLFAFEAAAVRGKVDGRPLSPRTRPAPKRPSPLPGTG
jgi:hypothetical protein